MELKQIYLCLFIYYYLITLAAFSNLVTASCTEQKGGGLGLDNSSWNSGEIG